MPGPRGPRASSSATRPARRRPRLTASTLRVLHVAAELTPWAETGGLGQVVGALPPALAALDPTARIAVLTPLYATARDRLAAAGVTLVPGPSAALALDGRSLPVRIASRTDGGVTQHFLDCPVLFDRPGLYGAAGFDYPDNAVRFAALARAAAQLGDELLGGAVDVYHLHDWHPALVPAYLSRPTAARTVLTIHNLAFQGLFPAATCARLGLDGALFHAGALEFFGQLGFLKGGVALADAVTTVSPTYAREILEPAHGAGLDGLLRHRGVVGIGNGLDTAAWDPVHDPHLAATYAATRLRGKRACRRALADELGLVASDDLLLGVVSRLTAQKGIDLLLELVPALVGRSQLALLGSGEPALERAIAALAARWPGRVGVRLGFDEGLAHRIVAGADVLVMPSRFEPCGLTQLAAQRYGTLPVVRATGGLADTVEDADASDRGTGFAFAAATPAALAEAIDRAQARFADRRAWLRLQRNAMARDVSWAEPARRYLALYRDLAQPVRDRARER